MRRRQIAEAADIPQQADTQRGIKALEHPRQQQERQEQAEQLKRKANIRALKACKFKIIALHIFLCTILVVMLNVQWQMI